VAEPIKVWDMDSGGLKNPYFIWGPRSPKGRHSFRGISPSPLKSIGNIQHVMIFSTLFSRWRQQCGLLLSVLRGSGSGSSSSRNVSKFESFSSSVSIQSDELVRTLSTVFVLYSLTDASGQREMCDAG